jgi:hypothetical protein
MLGFRSIVHVRRYLSTVPENLIKKIENGFLNKKSCDKYYHYFNPHLHDESSELLNALANCEMSKDLKNGVIALTLNGGASFGLGIGADTLFVRDFYPELFTKIRSKQRICLIGNPGTQKSTFQFYYLARLLNSKLGPLPKDYLGSIVPPKVVLRQDGDSILIHFLEEKVTHSIPNFNTSIFELFDPKTCIYFFEPGSTKDVEPCYTNNRLPIFATVSPLISRYKEFIKNGAMKLFMPCLELDELLTIGEYLLNNDKIPVKMHDLYSQEKIKERFNEYGGIYRHVLPLHKSYLQEIAKQKISSINKLTKEKIDRLLLNPNIEDQTIGHFLLQYKVLKEGLFSFENYTMEFVNDNIIKILQKNSNALSY